MLSVVRLALPLDTSTLHHTILIRRTREIQVVLKKIFAVDRPGSEPPNRTRRTRNSSPFCVLLLNAKILCHCVNQTQSRWAARVSHSLDDERVHVWMTTSEAMISTQLARNIRRGLVRTASFHPSPIQRHCDHISATSVSSKVRSATRPQSCLWVSTKLRIMIWPFSVVPSLLPQHYVRGDPMQIGRTPKEGCATEKMS